MYAKRLGDRGFRVIKDSSAGTRIDKIIRGRNIVRDEFLKCNADSLFFLDSDVIMRPDFLSRLVSHGKDLVSGLYLANFDIGDHQEILPVAFQRHDASRVRHMRRAEVEKDALIQITYAGLGCTLISRRVVEKISFRNVGSSTVGGEDTAFFQDALKEGFTPYCDTSIKCLHMKFPRGDSRNKAFSW